jgi:hypothetical protein
MATTADALEAMRVAKVRVPVVIRRLMRFYDVTGSQLAPVLGVGRAAFYSRLQGSTVIRVEELAALAEYFRLPVEVFYLEPDEALRAAATTAGAGPDKGPGAASPSSGCITADDLFRRWPGSPESGWVTADDPDLPPLADAA